MRGSHSRKLKPLFSKPGNKGNGYKNNAVIPESDEKQQTEQQDVSSSCGINCMPTFHFYKNNQKVHEFSGANVVTLKEKVKELR